MVLRISCVMAALAVMVFLVGGALAGIAATGYECRFSQGQSWSYTKGAFRAGAPDTLDFSITDVKVGVARARLNGGKNFSPLKVVQALDASHFIEVTVAGFLNITTIYDADETAANYPAVHSRHLGILGQPLVAQYRGACRAVR